MNHPQLFIRKPSIISQMEQAETPMSPSAVGAYTLPLPMANLKLHSTLD